MEIWKDLVGFEDVCQISSLGRIRTKDKYAKVCGGGQRLVKGKYLKPAKCKNGYFEIQLNHEGKRHIMLLHRAIAQAFIPNPLNLPQVNHKDEDISNNVVDNLEWCTAKYNANYGTRNERSAISQRKAVFQMDLDGNIIKKWDSLTEAGKEFGSDGTPISRCCRGIQETSFGCKWKFA